MYILITSLSVLSFCFYCLSKQKLCHQLFPNLDFFADFFRGHTEDVHKTGGWKCRAESGACRVKRWTERLNVNVNVCYLSTWIGAKRVVWPHHRLVVHHSWLCHHHGTHIGRLMGEEKNK